MIFVFTLILCCNSLDTPAARIDLDSICDSDHEDGVTLVGSTSLLQRKEFHQRLGFDAKSNQVPGVSSERLKSELKRLQKRDEIEAKQLEPGCPEACRWWGCNEICIRWQDTAPQHWPPASYVFLFALGVVLLLGICFVCRKCCCTGRDSSNIQAGLHGSNGEIPWRRRQTFSSHDQANDSPQTSSEKAGCCLLVFACVCCFSALVWFEFRSALSSLWEKIAPSHWLAWFSILCIVGVVTLGCFCLCFSKRFRKKQSSNMAPVHDREFLHTNSWLTRPVPGSRAVPGSSSRSLPSTYTLGSYMQDPGFSWAAPQGPPSRPSSSPSLYARGPSRPNSSTSLAWGESSNGGDRSAPEFCMLAIWGCCCILCFVALSYCLHGKVDVFEKAE